MIYRHEWILLTLSVLVFSFATPLQGQIQIDIETGGVFSGYNDVRIPNGTGTLFSLSEDLNTDTRIFFRIQFRYTFRQRHAFRLLIAPLSLKATGNVDRDIRFEGKTFTSGTPLEGSYRFNSYRFSYLYALKKTDRTEIGLGITGKIRDAEVALNGGGQTSTKTNVGFVPLLHFRFRHALGSGLSLIIEGDAAAAPQGRAEDVLAALGYRVSERMGITLGYRILEGGADVDEVYNFALLHYVALGITVTL